MLDVVSSSSLSFQGCTNHWVEWYHHIVVAVQVYHYQHNRGLMLRRHPLPLDQVRLLSFEGCTLYMNRVGVGREYVWGMHVFSHILQCNRRKGTYHVQFGRRCCIQYMDVVGVALQYQTWWLYTYATFLISMMYLMLVYCRRINVLLMYDK